MADQDEPTLGAIKRALHDLSCTDRTGLREAHELLRQLAGRNGIDLDEAVQSRRAIVKLQRERLVCASTLAADQTSR
jgi:hypothetical protein